MTNNKTRIPKTIHYCWFGKNPKNDLAIKCIESWKKHCPGYKIVEWNESNFDINCNPYVKEAYEAKKWAFVTDYVRLFAIVNEGGIYMDTDVEVLKPLDPFLVEEGFSGFEDQKNVPTGIMGCRKNNKTFKSFLDYYNGRHFRRDNGTLDLTTNVTTITNYCKKIGLVENNSLQHLPGITLYPTDFFCPKDHKTGIVNITDNTYTIHHFSGSWLPDKSRKYKELNKKLANKFGKTLGNILYSIASFPYRLKNAMKETGIKGAFKKVLIKMRLSK